MLWKWQMTKIKVFLALWDSTLLELISSYTNPRALCGVPDRWPKLPHFPWNCIYIKMLGSLIKETLKLYAITSHNSILMSWFLQEEQYILDPSESSILCVYGVFLFPPDTTCWFIVHHQECNRLQSRILIFCPGCRYCETPHRALERDR